jgi:glycosyltransferase involved in cell wall biosynthesis
MKFSVLMSVYIAEKAEYLDACLKSLYEQTRQAEEIIIVEDGRISDSLDSTLQKWQSKLPIRRHALKDNVGLGRALNAGLNLCNSEIIARMDTDDICLPERFELQLKRFEEDTSLEILGGAIAEFNYNIESIQSYRTSPHAKSFHRYIKYRNPINHMTVMFKKSTIQSVGGYLDLMYMEDYYLWMRCYKEKCKMDNLQDILVYARIGNGMHTRRRGIQYLKSELKLHKIRKDCLNLSNHINLLITFLRIVPRLMNGKSIQKVYQHALRK